MSRLCCFQVLFFTVSIVGCEQFQQSQKPMFSPIASWYFQRDDNLIDDDRYVVRIDIFHDAAQTINGKYIVRAYGDVFGQGGQESSDTYGDNYDETDFKAFPPGSANAASFMYYINDPALAGSNNLSPEQAKAFADMTITIDFIPASTNEPYRGSSSTFIIAGGKGAFKE